MIVSRTRFYLLLVLTIVGLCLLYQAVWLFSRVTNGQITAFGSGLYGRYRSAQNTTISYQAGDQIYNETYLRNGISDTTTMMNIRYLIPFPSISRENTLIGNWAGPFLFFIISFVIITIVFLQDGVIPFTASFRLDRKYPFILVIGSE